MKKKNGFTLIEILAVIIILVIIMSLLVPKKVDVIETNEVNVTGSSLNIVKDAIKTQITISSMMEETFIKEDECYLFDFSNNNENVQKLSIKNKDKISGSIKYCDGNFKEDNLSWNGK